MFRLEYEIVGTKINGQLFEYEHIQKPLITSYEEKLRANLEYFRDKGLKVCKIYEGALYGFTFDYRYWIDIYIMREVRGILRLPWRWSCVSICNCVMPKKYFTGWDEIEFMGQKCLCPADPEKLLEFWYGPDWRIPQNKKGKYEVRPIYYIKQLGHLFSVLASKTVKSLRFIFSPTYRYRILRRKRMTGSYFHKRNHG